MVIPVVFLLLVVVSPTAAIIDTDGIQNFPDFNTDFGGIGGGGDGNLGLGILAAPLIGLALLAAIAGRSGTGTTVVPGATVIASPVPVPTPCPACPMTPATVCPTLTPCNPTKACPANYMRLSVPANTPGVAAGTVLPSCYSIIPNVGLSHQAATQLCAAGGGVPVEFNTAGEFAAITARLTNTGVTGNLFTGHTDVFTIGTGVVLGTTNGAPAVGAQFIPIAAVGVLHCGLINAPAAVAVIACGTAQMGVVCEIRLDGATCVCPPGTG